MPLYEYSCHRCGETFEVMQKFSDLPLAIHEGCGGEVVRLISVSALQFKGTGWYVTDYGGKSKSASGKSGDSQPEGKPEAQTETKTKTKAETKAASKPESKPAPKTSSSDK
jgi:putative FmdB family regulatory protein